MWITKKFSIIVVLIIGAVLLFNINKIIQFVRTVILPGKVLVVKYFPFSEGNSLREWEEKIFKGKVLYSITKENHQSFVLASSDKTASALYYKIKMDMTKRPVISWKWNAQKFPLKNMAEDLRDAAQDDFAARVYVIFPALFFTNSKALEYIWAENIPEGTIDSSPYSKNLKLVVVESGKKPESQWISEERDVCADYIAAYGQAPKLNIGAVAFMTDADSTGTNAESFYDDIKIGYKEDIDR